MNNKEDKKKSLTLYNCHTHIFTIDHVPNLFGKKMLPLFYQLITMRLIKWYYLNLTKRNSRFKNFIYKRNKVKYFLIDALKFTVVGYWIFSILWFFSKWAGKIIINMLALGNFFGTA